jgi:hypothetical protein
MKKIKELTHDDYYRGYVHGFLFSEDLKQVLLLRRPETETLRGIGGMVLNGGSHLSAMNSSFKFETGKDFKGWQYLKSISVLDDLLYCHVFYGVGDLKKYKPLYSVEVFSYSVENVLKKKWKPVKISSEVATLVNGAPTEGFEIELGKGVAKLVKECQLNLLNAQHKIQ